MVTKEQAMQADTFHSEIPGDACTRKIGPRGGIKERVYECRRSGRTQTWKRDLSRFRVPVKYGLYEHGEITERNAGDFHLPEDCPLARTDGEVAAGALREALDPKGLKP